VRNERTIRHVRDLMSEAINFSPTYIWETDRQGRYTFVQGQEKILGRSDLALIGENRWAQLCGADCDVRAADCQIVAAIAQRRPIERKLLRSRHVDGTEVWISCSAQPVFDEAGAYLGYRGVDVDVTELTLAQRELEQMALHDPLTGLANRRKFMSRYELELARQRRSGGSLSLLLIDIDHFKEINDRWGHLVGDDCLRRIANVLSSNLRVVDLIARFGGEEFIVLLCDTGLEQALRIAEQLRQVVAATRLEAPDGTTIGLTVSIGVASRPDGDARDFDQLLADADAGAYAAKHAGRDRVCVGSGTASG
jgi:diguanylate cyclase (GGDEF)-like protein/PAS domain S-box-containing protein